MLAEYLWRTNSGWEHNGAVGGVFQKWQQWITSAVQIFTSGMQVPVHCGWKCIVHGADSIEKLCNWECALSIAVTVSFVFIIVSM